MERVVLERRAWPAASIRGTVRGRVVDVPAVIQDGDERMVPVLERDRVSGHRLARKSVRTDGDERFFPGGLDETERTRDAVRFAQPLKRVLGAVADLRPAEKPLEQPLTRGARIDLSGTRMQSRPSVARAVGSCLNRASLAL